MNTITIAWISLPLIAGFVLYLFPKLDRYLALFVAIVSAGYAVRLFVEPSALNLELLDNFGVTLIADQFSSYFILTNALVTSAVILYCWNRQKKAFFYTQTIILHGSVNSVFICGDFISVYVALEVIGVAAFLLISYPRGDRSIWVALRYLFVSNTAMLFYLVGAVLVYKANNSFAFAGLENAPPEAFALIVLGLLSKGGVFISGLWLPLTHSESETPVSAMLSGVVVKTGVFPLLRCALILDEIDPVLKIFGIATAFLGVTYAILEKDTKRTLAYSSISQLGFILVSPIAGGFYALTHGLAKSALFLLAGALPSRNFQELRKKPTKASIWLAMLIPCLSISGFPLFAGFAAKTTTLKGLENWSMIAMSIAAVGTAIVFAKFIFLPYEQQEQGQSNLWMPMLPLLGGLIVGNGLYSEVYTLENLSKAVLTAILGWLAYLFIVRRFTLTLPRLLEKFENLIGMMSLMLIALFWMVLA
ncbi:MAG: cation:proton antiporter [Cyanobacteria bacterium J06592_8]